MIEMKIKQARRLLEGDDDGVFEVGTLPFDCGKFTVKKICGDAALTRIRKVHGRFELYMGYANQPKKGRKIFCGSNQALHTLFPHLVGALGR